MSSLPNYLTVEEYLEMERKAEYKSEYYNGQMFAMSGVSNRHAELAGQLQLLIRTHLRGKKCGVYGSDLRVLVNPGGLYTYPDMSVVCGEAQFADSSVDTLVNPVLIVEVIALRTELNDQGQKARLYRGMPSLAEYLMLSQDSYEVDLQRKCVDGAWTIIDAAGLDSSVELTSIGYTLQLRELYERLLPEVS